jgi:hypothetical protein
VEISIELTEVELDLVTGGAGSASLSVSNTASGTDATVSGSALRALQPHRRASLGPFRPLPPKAHCFGGGAGHPRRFP